MLLLAAAAIAASTPHNNWQPSAGAVVQARAFVRIVSGARLKWDDKPSGDVPRPRMTIIKTAEGAKKAKLIEFE
jgi:hypothetical protein